MSFGYTVDDVLALIQLSWSTVEGATRACGKHDNLTEVVSSLYDALAHVYSELSLPESSIGTARSTWKAELGSHLTECGTQLRIINPVLDQFNTLSSEQKSGKQLWTTIRSANGEDHELAEIRSRMATYSTAITMSLRLISLGSRGKVERQLIRQKGSLVRIRESINLALAQMNSTTRHQSLILAFSNDSKAFWRRLRRELEKDGLSRSALNNKKDLILSYMKELDSRGVLGYSTSFQKSMKAQNEAKRQSNTPASFQSSTTLTVGRKSNSSLQSFEPLKDSGYRSPDFDEPICIRTGSDDPSWPGSRPVTAVEREQCCDVDPTDIRVETKDQFMELPSPSISYVRNEPSTVGSTSPLSDETINMPVQKFLMHSHSHHGSIASFRSQRLINETEQKVKLEDPIGREFSFPLSQAKTWEGMEHLIKKNCAGLGSVIGNAHQDGTNLFPYLWEEMAEPGAKLTIRRPCTRLVQPSSSVFCPPSEEFYLLPERPSSPEDDFSHLPTLRNWIQGGRTEFTPHSEFYEMD